MDRQEWHDRLNSTAEDPAELFEHFDTRSTDGRTYHALPDARHGVERGTVLLESAGVIVKGYPSVPRVLVLDPGIPRFFESEEAVTVEEKLDGFNVRVVDADGVLAFTRGGYVCPFTTGRARDLLDTGAFFADHPEKMLCAELIGPETPYTNHDYDGIDTHEFRVFDVRERATGDPLSVERRRALCEQYGFARPQSFGRYTPEEAIDAVTEAIETLAADEREGVVLKSDDGRKMVKYTTRPQHHNELAYALSLPFEYGRDFLFSRLIREAFQAAELEDVGDLRGRARDLGESILLPMVETIEAVGNGETVGEEHTIRGDHEEVEALLDHLRSFSLTLELVEDRREGRQRVVTFRKVAESTQDHIEYYLEGGTVDDVRGQIEDIDVAVEAHVDGDGPIDDLFARRPGTARLGQLDLVRVDAVGVVAAEVEDEQRGPQIGRGEVGVPGTGAEVELPASLDETEHGLRS
jgi:putative ATP-dependent DNA ligase